MDLIGYGLAGLAAIAVLLMFYAVARLGPADVNERIQRYGSAAEVVERPSTGRQNLSDLFASNTRLTALNKAVEQRDFGANMARDLARADLQLKVSEFLLIWATSTIAVPVGFLVLAPLLRGLGTPLALVVGAAVGFALPRLWVQRRIRSRTDAFNAQLPDTIVLMANALRAGSSFLQSAEMVVREETQPISMEFGRLVREVNLGLPFEQAIENMVRRLRSDDFELMAIAITVQYQVGGNLAEILDTIAFTIRERIRIKGEIRVLTAQQRLSGYIVGLLPLGLITFLYVAVPNFLAPMFKKPPAVLDIPLGIIMLAGAGLMMVTGFLIIRRIVDIDV